MRIHAIVVSATALLMLATVTHPVAAQDASAPAASVFSPDSRVRCLDGEARRLLEAAVAVSPTIARLVTELQSTDLIVGIEAHTSARKGVNGDARVIAVTSVVRHVRVRVAIPGVQSDLIAVLGHELQHAVEIAAAPDVREAASLRAHYLRIGYEPAGRGYYETHAALEVGRHVSAEVAASRQLRRVAGQ
jgi:hypothetical protein